MDEALFELNKVVQLLSGKSIKDFGLPMPAYTTNSDLTNSVEYTRETSYKIIKKKSEKSIYCIISTIDISEGKWFSLML